MTAHSKRRFRPGGKIGSDHTILAVIDKAPGRHPILIVWDHRSWCPMACKVFASPEKARMEAEILSSLNHPTIVRLLGTAGDTDLFVEFVDGKTLADLLDFSAGGRLRVSDALRIAIHLGGALEHLHARGFVHLDLAPSNVILRRDGRPVLIDFGAARRYGGGRPPRPIGTDAYMAPEECLLGPVSPAADVFSLGALLYELLTGDLPFPRGTPRNPFPQTVQEPVPARRLRPTLPKALQDLLHACLRHSPEARPSLPVLLPALHDHIRAGPRMWPAGFQPNSPGPGARSLSHTG
jgi:serine/threonine protein kinase